MPHEIFQLDADSVNLAQNYYLNYLFNAVIALI